MLVLHSYYRSETGLNMSPFCLKTETWLRQTGLEFRLEEHSDARKMPKLKLPVLQHGDKMIADSHLIEKWCKKQFDIDPDAWLSPDQQARAHALRVMAEERGYWILFWYRWAKDENWMQLKEMFFGQMPPVIRDLAAWKVRDIMLKTLKGQGMGRFCEDEILAFAMEDLDAIETQLGESPWLMGAQFSSVDAAVFGVVQNMRLPFDTPLSRSIMERPRLLRWLARMEDDSVVALKAA